MLSTSDPMERIILSLVRVYTIEKEYRIQSSLPLDSWIEGLRTIPKGLPRREIYEKLKNNGTISQQEYDCLT